ncbi:formylglycine-generating enzyme family protein [Sphingomonas sp. F9_3S_D5_B_2]
MKLRTAVTLGLAAMLAGAAEGKHPLRTFHDCHGCPVMVALPSGHFLMGSPEKEPGRDAVEGPQRRVAIRSFAMGKYDVTRGEWAAFVSASRPPTQNGCEWSGLTRDHESSANWRHLGFAQSDRHPVVCVTWDDAQAYARWLSKRTGKHYRLPSESEWEYAARAGTDTAFYWRADASHARANYGKPECCGGLTEGPDKWLFTSPVDAFPPNAFGLHDMAGNVLQYVADCFVPSYARAPKDGSAVVGRVKLETSSYLADLNGTNSCDYRVVRGGDWGDRPAWIRSAARNFAPPPGDVRLSSYRSGGVGFRVARDLP